MFRQKKDNEGERVLTPDMLKSIVMQWSDLDDPNLSDADCLEAVIAYLWTNDNISEAVSVKNSWMREATEKKKNLYEDS